MCKLDVKGENVVHKVAFRRASMVKIGVFPLPVLVLKAVVLLLGANWTRLI